MASVFAGFGDNAAAVNIPFLEMSILQAMDNMENFVIKNLINTLVNSNNNLSATIYHLKT